MFIYVWLQVHVWFIGDRMFESILGEGDRVSLGETTLEEETGGVGGRQTLEAIGRVSFWPAPPLTPPLSPYWAPSPSLLGLPPQTTLHSSSLVDSPISPAPTLQGLTQTTPIITPRWEQSWMTKMVTGVCGYRAMLMLSGKAGLYAWSFRHLKWWMMMMNPIPHMSL